MDTMIQRSYYEYLQTFVKERLDILLHKKVFIFGAGVRGRNLLLILKMFKISDISFVDTNPKKQGTAIEGCVVWSFVEAAKYTEPHVFLCPTENNRQILEQLEQTGRTKDIDYFDMEFYFSDYLDVVEEVMRPGEHYTLALGNCIFSSCILSDKFVPSFGESMKKELLGTKVGKVCSLPGLSTGIYYHIINILLQKYGKKHLKCVLLAMEISCFSPHAPMLLGHQVYQQHKLFLQQLTNFSSIPVRNDLIQYTTLITERCEASKTIENPIKSFDFKSACNYVYELKYNFDVEQTNESVLYTKKILECLNSNHIPTILYFPPIDYRLGEQICGKKFIAKYRSIVEKIKELLSSYSFDCIDASFLLNSDCFAQQYGTPDINPWLNQKGQEEIIKFLKMNKVVKKNAIVPEEC